MLSPYFNRGLQVLRRRAPVHRRSLSVDLPALRASQGKEIAALSEVVEREHFEQLLRAGDTALPASGLAAADVGINPDMLNVAIDAAFATNQIHTESRIASLLGQGFYTIGPCGEELLAAVGLALRPTDAAALHYRHLSTQFARQLQVPDRTMEDVLLDRARGYAVSASDPVTGGAHCALGGGPHDFLVTSTLASQSTPAVGRALAGPLARKLPGVDSLFPSQSISYVSLGDGSVNNAHFLSALNLADMAQFKGFKCPALFGISDNNLCISLRGQDWLPRFLERRSAFPSFVADGMDFLDVFDKTQRAVDYVREKQRPAVLVFAGVPRRFGHAATDRQLAYMEAEEVSAQARSNPLVGLCAYAVREGVATHDELLQRFQRIGQLAGAAFDEAVQEPKLTSREDMAARSSQPLVPVPDVQRRLRAGAAGLPRAKPKPAVMRKHMTHTFDEALSRYPELVYMGEDVVHGGYYVVTEGLAEKYPLRVRDFPPDETALLGAAMGYAQAGLLPVCEIPYAKYLDCGADMFFEIAIANWLSNAKQPNGMVIRLQGFGQGVFGGNFHTHNMLHMPPGIDVVCYSNGRDYARGMRYCLEQARAGRVVMSVDSTSLLNLRHVAPGAADNLWLTSYPEEDDGVLPFHEVVVHSDPAHASAEQEGGLAIVTYGHGVVHSLNARDALASTPGFESTCVTVIDVPLLSEVSEGLRAALRGFDRVVFADVCKQGQQPMASIATALHADGDLPARWSCVASPRCYNPLGNTITFLNADDIVECCAKLEQRHH